MRYVIKRRIPLGVLFSAKSRFTDFEEGQQALEALHVR